MKLKSIAAAAVLAACGLTAQAQTSPPPPPPAGAQHMQMHDGEMHQRMQERMQQHMQRRMERLKRILQIAPNQEGAWNNWAAAIRPNPANMEQRHRMHEEFARMSTPERIDRMRQMRAQRAVESDRRGDATKAFYAQLTGPQQKAFDEISLKFMHGKRDHRDHHGM
jgi:protein CpxP